MNTESLVDSIKSIVASYVQKENLIRNCTTSVELRSDASVEEMHAFNDKLRNKESMFTLGGISNFDH